MASELWILRHGEAVGHDSRVSDGDRELTARGERQASAAGAALSRLGVELAACYSSPKVRARDTARLACRALNVEPDELSSLAGGFGLDDARELLMAYDAGEHVLLIGHEPDLSQLVHDATGARIDMKKGGLAVVELDGRAGQLLVLLRPRELEALALGTTV
jgi:phosphohistidine phosphatase